MGSCRRETEEVSSLPTPAAQMALFQADCSTEFMLMCPSGDPGLFSRAPSTKCRRPFVVTRSWSLGPFSFGHRFPGTLPTAASRIFHGVPLMPEKRELESAFGREQVSLKFPALF